MNLNWAATTKKSPSQVVTREGPRTSIEAESMADVPYHLVSALRQQWDALQAVHTKKEKSPPRVTEGTCPPRVCQLC
jgi:hypothetical protein